MTQPTDKKLSRRDALKLLGAAAGASVLANLPSKWSTPQLTAGVLPAHAQSSAICDQSALVIEKIDAGTMGTNYGNPSFEYGTGWGRVWECTKDCAYWWGTTPTGMLLGVTTWRDGTFTVPVLSGQSYWIYLDVPSGNYNTGSGTPVLTPPTGSECKPYIVS